jgi:hypothetical protein
VLGGKALKQRTGPGELRHHAGRAVVVMNPLYGPASGGESGNCPIFLSGSGLARSAAMRGGLGGLLLHGGARERVFCAAHSCRPLIVAGGSKELRGMDRRGGGPFGGGV